VRGDWRRYLNDLSTPGINIGDPDEIDSSTFNILTVNIEANGKRTPIPYVLPPGIEREVDYSTTELLEQNEQSLAFEVCDLEDGDARAAYKNTAFDVRMYKKLRMYVHAEGENLEKGDLSLFIRLGTDFDLNYYEYEIPLDPTPYGTNDPELIWKKANEIELEFSQFFRVKQTRESTPGVNQQFPFTMMSPNGKGRITVTGNPDLSNIKVIMIGVRNPSKDDNPYKQDDMGLNQCGIVWVNELRVTDFDEKGGWAAVGRASAKLADVGKVTFSGNIKTIGFGGLEQSLQERSREDVRSFDFQTFLEIGKFFPARANVRIPMYYNYSQSRVRPQFNPLVPDILLQASLDNAKTQEEVDSIVRATETFVKRRSINFMNVQKLPAKGGGNKDPHFWNVENFMISYIYNDIFKRDVNTTYDFKQTHQLILNYNYSFRDKTITPLKKLSKSKYLRLITDFNVGLLPQSVSFRTQIDRRYSEILYRNNSSVTTLLEPQYDKNFAMKRIYEYRHNLTRSIRFTYTATADVIIDEPDGPITDEARDTIRQNLLNFGRTRYFNQKVNLAYDVPLRKIPLLNWVSLRANYTGNYNWSEPLRAAMELGSVLQNSQTIQINGQLNMTTLYSKIEFLKNINAGRSNYDKMVKKKQQELKAKSGDDGSGKTDKTEEEGDGEEDEEELVNETLIKTIEQGLGILMSLKNVTLNYTVNNGTTLPGFDRRPGALGNEWTDMAPGIPFILGIQNDDFRFEAARNGWLVYDTTLANSYLFNHTENLTGQANIEPFKGFRLNVDFTRRFVKNQQEIFRYDEFRDNFNSYSPVESGSFTISFWSFKTALKGKWDDEISPVYKDFEKNRNTIARRISDNAIDPTTGYPIGYGPTNQDVLIPSFLSAYAGQSASDYSLDMFRKIPAPNWRLTFNGLSRIDFVKQYAKNVNINHAYRSTFTVGNYATNLSYSDEQDIEPGENFVSEYNIQQISINEQLSPLIGVDISWVNNWTTRVEFRSTRNINFSFSNYQTTEVLTRDFVVGIGYRAKEVKLPKFIKIKGKQAILQHDLNFRFDVTVKNNRSTIARLDEGVTESVGGNQLVSIKPIVDYVIDDNLTIRFFFNRNVTRPVISTSYPTAFTNGGFSIRYTLGM
jgi:cell surface protein SprA